MWTAIIGFLGGPVIRGLLDAYNAKLKAGNVDKAVSIAKGTEGVKSVDNKLTVKP